MTRLSLRISSTDARRVCISLATLFVVVIFDHLYGLGAEPEGTPQSSKPASSAPTPTAKSEPLFMLYMPDGQLKSHRIRIYVKRNVQAHQKPQLELLRGHAVMKQKPGENASHEPSLIAPGQEWTETVDGQEVRQTGTLLMFDLGALDFEWKAMLRVMPVVSWQEADVSRVAVAQREVNIGNIVAALSWTAGIVGAVVLAIIVLSRRNKGRALWLLTGVDGHLSLAQSQIALWTLAVGSIVLMYGLIRLEIPSIPTSLLVLMGASLATGGVAFYQDAQKQQPVAGASPPVITRQPALGDLIRNFPTGATSGELSLAKAQMLFWTLLLLVLFLSKSILDGNIWEIPWALVALMGSSQAGYLTPKLVPPSPPAIPPTPALPPSPPTSPSPPQTVVTVHTPVSNEGAG